MIEHGLLGRIRRAVVGPVSRVTIHHEGSGVPCDFARGAHGGYSVWIGAATWTALRSPYVSFATLHYNHVSLDICLSGNREVCYVGTREIEMIRAAVADYRARGWVARDVTVVQHTQSPGSNTVCPGRFTIAQWPHVVAACTGLPAPTPVAPKDEEMFVVLDEIHVGLDAAHPRVAAVDPANNGRILLGNGAVINAAARAWNGLTIVDPGYQPGEKYVGSYLRRDEHGRVKGWTQMSLLTNGQWGTRDYWFAKGW